MLRLMFGHEDEREHPTHLLDCSFLLAATALAQSVLREVSRQVIVIDCAVSSEFACSGADDLDCNC